MLTREDLLAAAEALAAILDEDLPLLRELSRRDPIKLEQIGWNLRDRASGKALGGESWQEGLVAAELVCRVARGELVPRLTGAKGDMIAEVQDILTRLALEPPAANRRARREAAAIERRLLH